jgi:hypothetical protein
VRKRSRRIVCGGVAFRAHTWAEVAKLYSTSSTCAPSEALVNNALVACASLLSRCKVKADLHLALRVRGSPCFHRKLAKPLPVCVFHNRAANRTACERVRAPSDLEYSRDCRTPRLQIPLAQRSVDFAIRAAAVGGAALAVGVSDDVPANSGRPPVD